ncbi:hypothetical protein QAD02_010582 [Eretmocerus hayati]|uniref:Uncharacterized protein n=1 Tax=Eretmocerus hayati TaxID=131215 RepID=A0ACC2NUF7_9HYME|nr:hypothetical protein QAD02_010582 [Eretmocerus hayati]
MDSVTRIIFLFLFFCSCSIDPSFQESNFQKSWSIHGSDGQITSGKFDLAKKRFPFALCTANETLQELFCTVNVQKLKDETSSSVHSCHLKLNTMKNNTFFEPSFHRGSIEIVQFLGEKDKVIITWDEKNTELPYPNCPSHQNVIILDYTTCKTKHLHYSVDTSQNCGQLGDSDHIMKNVVVYQDSFDVIVTDKDKCGKLERCRLTYDQHGNQMGEPNFVTPTRFIGKTDAALSTTPSKGFFTVNWFIRSVDVIHVSPNGTETGLLHVPNDIEEVLVKSSNSYEKYTLCLKPNDEPGSNLQKSAVNCRQYNIDKISEDFSVIIDFPKGTKAMAVQNLPNGGFHLLTVECKTQGVNSGSSNGEHGPQANATVTKVSPNGQKTVVLSNHTIKSAVGDLICLDPKSDIIFSLNDDQFCVYFSFNLNRVPDTSVAWSAFEKKCSKFL